MKKKIILSSIIFVVIVVFGIAKVKASDLTGWIWGGSNDGGLAAPSNPIDTGFGWASMSSTNPTAGAGATYGVSMDPEGNLSGYAWSSNVGWINFSGVKLGADSSSGYAHIVNIDTENTLGNSGGWNGGIDMSGVKISGDFLSGYGWHGGGETIGVNYYGLGWIDFSGVSINCIPDYGDSYVCPSSPTGNVCNQTNCNQTITTQTSVCYGVDTNKCGHLLTKQDCIDNGVPCSDDLTEICNNDACALKEGAWKEVAP